MQVTYVATGSVTAGKLQVRNRQAFEDALAQFRDGEVLVTVERLYATRSEQQNRWYWGQIMRLLAQYTGHSSLELHEYCKKRFNPLPITIVDEHGEIKDEETVGGTTTKLNKLTFGDYCEAIRQWARDDLGVVIPDPQ